MLAPILSFLFFPFRKISRVMRSNSIKLEISILYTIILGVILVIFSGVLYSILSHTLYTELDYELKLKAEEVSQSIRTYLDTHKEDPQAMTFALDKTIGSEGKIQRRWWFTGFERRWYKRLDDLDLAGGYINFVSADLNSVVRTKNLTDDILALFLNAAQDPQKDVPGFATVTYAQTKIRLINYPFRYDSGEIYQLQVGMSPSPITQLMQDWLHSITISIPIILFLAFFVGHILASRIIDPVNALTAAARKITSEDLHARVETDGTYIEFQFLASAFNDMISRLEQSFKHIEEFSGHVAHELKTPLSVIRGEAELALRRERDIKDYKRALKVNLEESERMMKTIDDLLLLTKLDYNQESYHFGLMDFVIFIKEVFEKLKLLAERKKIETKLTLPAQASLMVNVNQPQMRRLFLNLISNALKVTPANGQINIDLGIDGENIFVVVRDSGMGIPPDDLPNIFKRFYRIDNGLPGTGLGLSIASVITKIHGGQIFVESQVGRGAAFKVLLPLVTAI